MSCRSNSDAGCGSSGACKCAAASSDAVDNARRTFLRGAAALTVTTLAAGVTLYGFGRRARCRPRARRESDREGALGPSHRCLEMQRWLHGVRQRLPERERLARHRASDDRRPLDSQADGEGPKNGATFSLPMMCQHCAKPPCVDVCPTGASFRRADGIVLVDKHICIGCRYCMMACPYKARSFIHEPLDDQSRMRRAAKARWKAAHCAFIGSTRDARPHAWRHATRLAAARCCLAISTIRRAKFPSALLCTVRRVFAMISAPIRASDT